MLSSLAPARLSDALISWVPGHRGIHEYEIADQFAKVALSGLAYTLIPILSRFLIARYRRLELLKTTKPVFFSNGLLHFYFYATLAARRLLSRIYDVEFLLLTFTYTRLGSKTVLCMSTAM